MIFTITSVGLADGSLPLPARPRIVARAFIRGVSLPASCLLRS
jgi:hypothetical protein